MKLIKLLDKLGRARVAYIKKYGGEPEIFSVDSEEGFLLCAKVEKLSPGHRRAQKPYKLIKTGLEKFL